MGRLLLVCGLAWLAMASSPAVAQPPSRELGAAQPQTQPATTPPLAPPSAGISESKLGPVYLRDKNGVEVPYPSITLEEIERLIEGERQQRMAPLPPPYTLIPGATITGAVNEAAADLEVRIQVQLTKATRSEDAWVRVPLRLNQGVLLPPVSHTGPGEFLLESDPKGDGYVIWLRASPSSSHSFVLKLKAPLQLKNGVRQLVLAAPETPTSFRLTVSGNGTEARVNGNSGNILTTRRGAPGQSELIVDAAGGEIDLSWRELVELPPVLAAFGNILISLEGRQLEFDAQLNVRSYGPPIDSFTVRLPPGTDLIATNQFTQPGPGLEYSLLPESAGGDVGRRVLVRRKEGKTAGLIEARLRCHSNASVMDSTASWQLGGFEVIEAKHQKGTIDFQVDGDWSIDWLPDVNVRQVDDLPDVLRQQRLAARFEYDRQPFSLQAEIREKKTRISVEPTWTVSVSARRLSLQGLLKYRITGARAKPLEIDTAGWTIQQIAPADLLLPASWHVDGNRLTIPLSPNVQNGAGEFELILRATRELSPLEPNLDPALPPLGPGSVVRWNLQQKSTPLSFALPRPVSDAGLPAVLVVTPDDNIELTADTEHMRRLVSDTSASESNTSTRQSLKFREDVGGDPAVFVGEFRVRPQVITVAAESVVRIMEHEINVKQTFVHSVLNEPVKRLRYLVPSNVVDSGRLELMLDGFPTTWTRDPAATGLAASPGTSGDPVPIFVDLRDPRTGDYKAVFQHFQPRKGSEDADTGKLNVSLIQVPMDAVTTLKSHKLRLLAPGSLAVSLPKEQWSPLPADSASTVPGELLFDSTKTPASLQMGISLASGSGQRSTALQRVWVQSLLTDRERRERICFRLATNEQSLKFRLPRGVNTDYVTVAVNGEPTKRFRISNEFDLQVELGDALSARETTVEMWYWFMGQSAPFSRVLLQVPTLEGATHADRVYWQLLLPRHEYLAWHPRGLVSENYWEQRNFLWSRQPYRSQAELEKWVSASVQPDLVHEIPAGFNTYLFSSVGSLGGKTVYTVTRPTAVLGIAGCVLFLGAALLYLPALRHPFILLAAAVLVAATALIFPEPALAASQLIAVGIGLVLVTGLLMSLLTRPAVQRTFVRLPGQSGPDSRASKQPSGRLPALNSHVTTATLQAPVPVSATGNES